MRNDPFEELIRSKLGNFEHAPSDSIDQNVLSSVYSIQPRKTSSSLLIRRTVTAAFVLIAQLFTITIGNDPHFPIPVEIEKADVVFDRKGQDVVPNITLMIDASTVGPPTLATRSLPQAFLLLQGTRQTLQPSKLSKQLNLPAKTEKLVLSEIIKSDSISASIFQEKNTHYYSSTVRLRALSYSTHIFTSKVDNIRIASFSSRPATMIDLEVGKERRLKHDFSVYGNLSLRYAQSSLQYDYQSVQPDRVVKVVNAESVSYLPEYHTEREHALYHSVDVWMTTGISRELGTPTSLLSHHIDLNIAIGLSANRIFQNANAPTRMNIQAGYAIRYKLSHGMAIEIRPVYNHSVNLEKTHYSPFHMLYRGIGLEAGVRLGNIR